MPFTYPNVVFMICVVRCLNSGHTIEEVAAVSKRKASTIQRWLTDCGYQQSSLSGKWYHV